MEDYQGQIKLLVELQGLDTQIFHWEDELESIPEHIRSLESEYKNKTNSLKALEDGSKALQVKRNEKEVELETREVAIKKYQSQLNQVKTNKEYAALQEEIGRARADNSLIEEAILNLFDQIDAETKKIAKEREYLKEEEVRVGQEKARLDQEVSRIKQETEKLKSQRSELASGIDKGMLTKYERIVKNRNGLAVVYVAGDACQGCFRVLPPQVINEIKIGSGLVFCDNCARILYIEE